MAAYINYSVTTGDILYSRTPSCLFSWNIIIYVSIYISYYVTAIRYLISMGGGPFIFISLKWLIDKLKDKNINTYNL